MFYFEEIFYSQTKMFMELVKDLQFYKHFFILNGCEFSINKAKITNI